MEQVSSSPPAAPHSPPSALAITCGNWPDRHPLKIKLNLISLARSRGELCVDTMAYTASALAFLLHDLNKPVVLTGAQIPLCEYSSDATNNFRGALLSAGMGDLPGKSSQVDGFHMW
jgi:hypothetical protein